MYEIEKQKQKQRNKISQMYQFFKTLNKIKEN